ncbi:MAG TPA: neuraminidase-like domain-containing protein [Thermoanaerobaculia bacterium]
MTKPTDSQRKGCWPFRRKRAAKLAMQAPPPAAPQTATPMAAAAVPPATPPKPAAPAVPPSKPVDRAAAGEPFVVQGIVRARNDGPRTDGTVHAFARALREERPLGSAVPDQEGRYRITYSEAQLQAGQGRGALQVRFVEKDGTIAASSRLVFNPKPVETVDLTTGGERRGRSKHDRLTASIAPVLQGVSPADLRQDAQSRDVTFLAQATGASKKDIKYLALAHKLAKKTGVDAQVFFALFEQNIPASLSASLSRERGVAALDDSELDIILRGVADQPEANLRRAFRAGIRRNLIDESLATNEEQVLAQLRQVRVNVIAALAYERGKTPLSELIAATKLPKAAQDKFLELYATRRNMRRAVRELQRSADVKPDQVDDLRFTLVSAALLQNHMPLVKRVREQKLGGSLGEVRELARLTSDDWKKAIDASDPQGKAIVFLANVDLTDEERKRHFAEILAERFERRYPTTALASRLQRDTQSPIKAKDGVAKFLDKNADFQLRSAHIDAYLQKNPDALAGIENAETVVEELKRTQRVFHLNRRYSGVKAMLERGIDSATAAYARGRSGLIRELAGQQGLTASEVETIYSRAEAKYAMVLAVLGIHYTSSQLPVAAIAAEASATAAAPVEGLAAPALMASFPSLETLFGSGDFCECEHCNSVYGPAAYLADILQFLRFRVARNLGNAKAVLLQRVPWIAQVELSCDNTNIVLPYIDLVCEILEDAVAAPGLPALRARQTRGTAAELRAQPAYRNAAAYNTLAAGIFPLTLPFSLDTLEIRAFLSHLGVPWHQLMRRFQQTVAGNLTPTNVAMAAESLGISAAEYPLIVGAAIATHPNPWQHWGLQQLNNVLINPRTPDDPATNITGGWIDVLRRVPVFQQRTGLSYREVLQLLDARYVDPGNTLNVIDASPAGVAKCNTAHFRISGLADDAPSANALRRMQRFIRLWRKVGCTMWELDKILTSPNIGAFDINDALLSRLACIMELQRRVKPLPLDEMLVWWNDVDTFVYIDRLSDDEAPVKSVYQRLFRNPAVALPADNPFAENPAALAGTIVNALPQIAAAISASVEDVNRIRAAVGMGDAAVLTLPNLSVLLRHASLARAMDIRVEELLLLLTLTGVTPFASPANTLALLRLHRKIVEAGFTIYEVDYLLRHGSIDRAGLHLGDDAITNAVVELRAGLQKIADENKLPPREVVKKRLAARPELRDPALFAQAVTIIEGTWAGTAAARDAFIDARFAGFADPTAAKATLGPLAPGTPEAQAAQVEARYGFVAANLLAAAQVDFFRQKISDVTGLAPSVLDPFFAGGTLPGSAATIRTTIDTLLARALNGDYANAVSRAGFAALYASFTILSKSQVLIERLKLTVVETHWLARRASAFGWLDLESLPAAAAAPAAPFDAFRKLVLGVGLQHELRRTTTFFQALDAGTVAALASATGWDAAEITRLLNAFALAPGAVTNVDVVRRLRSCFDTARVLGSSIQQCLALANPTVGHPGAVVARQLTKAKYPLDEWFGVAASIQDVLREKKRDALVDWLLANPTPADAKRWQKPDDLYAYYLIDSQMSPCQLTTRLKQAAASVQLFVQRCLIQLEPNVVADATQDEDWKQWKWMKNYRVWEANRKIFLYPENWIEPELRDDKSPFFERLENDITQNDITNDVAEDALLSYLEKLSDVARLEIAAFYHEQRGATDILHVIGRTVTSPHIHYYRQRLGTGEWSAWEKIDIDITGDHLVAAVWNRRLHVFWPVFTEKSLDSKRGRFTIPASTSNATTPAPQKYWEIQVAFSEHKRGKWLPKKVTEQKLIGPPDDRSRYHLKVFPDRGKVTVDVFRVDGDPLHWGEVVIDGGSGQAVAYQTTAPLSPDYGDEAERIENLPSVNRKAALLRPAGFSYRSEALVKYWAEATLQVIEGPVFVSRPMLLKIDRPQMSIDASSLQFDTRDPFFFHDPQRTFFVWPVNPGYSGPTYYGGTVVTPTVYDVQGHYHPFVSTFIRELNSGGVDALYRRRLQTHPQEFHPNPLFSVASYVPEHVTTPYWTESVDFSNNGGYAGYNWEIFFHVPLLLATRLSKNQKFSEALRWFHRIFDPTNTGASPDFVPVPIPQRYWITKKFFEITAAEYQQQQIQKLLELVAAGDTTLKGQVLRWRRNPFNPHLLARLRPVAYQKSVVMKYLDNLIAWGDQLFRQDTIESINEATQLYVMAADLLGRRPERVRMRAQRVPKTYAELEPQFDAFSNAIVQVENVLPAAGTSIGTTDSAPLPTLAVFYFCIPPNEKLLGYWDVVADRLFKIRHCMNIEGRVRQLPLYEPPIDPALLVRAAAAGVDLSTALSDANAPLPAYRFTFMVQKATELCNDVRAFGSALLQVLEKKDAEALGALRSTREIALLEASRDVRKQQIEEARRNREATERQREMVQARKAHYDRLQFMNAAETTALALTTGALVTQAVAVALDTAAGVAHLVPQFQLGAAGFGGSPTAIASTGGTSFGQSAKAWADVSRGVSGILSSSAAIASTLATYQRRAEDWDLQRTLADRELAQLEKQAAAADIRIAVAELELRNHEKQIENAQAADEFLRTKYTNEELYQWMIAQTATTYFQTYQLAYDMARRADRAFAYETGGTEAPFIQFGYWDSLRKGLLAGEKLVYDIKRMEMAFYDRNERELEITKHVSLAALDPAALLALRRNGECTINLPESLFDSDYPGHFMRRIKSVALTIPAVVGPYTSLNCTLTNVSSSVRISGNAAGNYPHAVDGGGAPAPDARFRDSSGSTQAIATSHGQNDNGLFELTFRDERYLPFEGLGAISRWHLSMPRDTNRFDFDSLSDVVMTVRYTARDGGAPLRAKASAAAAAAMNSGVVLLSARRDFPDQWHLFSYPAGVDQTLPLPLRREHFPFDPRGRTPRVTNVALVLTLNADADYTAYAAGTALKLFVTPQGAGASAVTLNVAAGTQLPTGTAQWVGGQPLGDWSVRADEDDNIMATTLNVDVGAGPDLHHRLDRAKVDDLLIIAGYAWM